MAASISRMAAELELGAGVRAHEPIQVQVRCAEPISGDILEIAKGRGESLLELSTNVQRGDTQSLKVLAGGVDLPRVTRRRHTAAVSLTDL